MKTCFTQKKYWVIGLLALSLFGVASVKGYKYWYRHILKPDVTVAGLVQMADGLGRQCIELMDILYPDFDVAYKNSRAVDMHEVPQKFHKILKNRNKRPLGKVVVFEDTLAIEQKTFRSLFKNSSPYELHLAYSMFESSKIPTDFVDKLHTYFDAVIVPDPYLVSVYENAGVKIPIFSLPLGLNLSDFLNAPLKEKPQKPFVFANFSTCEDRKNHVLMIEAFAKAFGNNPDIILRIQSRRATETSFAAVTETIQRLGLDNVQFKVHVSDQKEYLENYKNIDCFVSFSKGEGFSIQPREAMAMGIPCIVSNNTAQSTICKSHLVKSIDSVVAEAAHYEGLLFKDLGSHFNISLEDGAKAFKEMYENYNDYLTKASDARKWASQFQFSSLKKYYTSLVKPKKIELGKENLITEEGIVTSSLQLYKKYMRVYPKLK